MGVGYTVGQRTVGGSVAVMAGTGFIWQMGLHIVVRKRTTMLERLYWNVVNHLGVGEKRKASERNGTSINTSTQWVDVRPMGR